MIELIVYPKAGDKKLINNSPFCSKTEIFLKLSKIDFKVNNFNGNPGKFPNKKLPVIKHNGNIIADSSLIQKYLEKEFKINLDEHLSSQEKAQGFAFTKMLEEYFYWSLLHERWFLNDNWEKLKAEYFEHIPFLIRGFITSMIRRDVKKSAIGHGISRHSDEHVLEFGKESIQNISNFIGDNKFLLGDKVSSYDSTAYAFISSVLHSPLGPILNTEALKYQNLVDYDARMFKSIYG